MDTTDIFSEMAKCSLSYIGDSEEDLDPVDNLYLFLESLFGRKRLLIIRVSDNKDKILKIIRKYCDDKNLEYGTLRGEELDVDAVRGELGVSYKEGIPYSYREKPGYYSKNKKMILIDRITKDTSIDVLRGFMYMASIGSYYDKIDKLPEDKLPYGSGYIFIAGDDFPLKEFSSISSYWNDETSVLDLRDFEIRVKEYLGGYKRRVLRIEEDGLYNYRGKIKSYVHILPEDKKDFNIIELYRKEYFSSPYSKIKLHKNFHHLNSSQALCINFFYPLIKEKSLESVMEVLGILGEIDYDKVCFEKDSYIGDGTSFDFYIELISGVKVYFEIKYTENGFGKAKDDDEHNDKFNDVYLPRLDKNKSIKDNFKTKEFFLNNYQVMRNILHIDSDSYVVFIYPKENTPVREKALFSRKEIMDSAWKDHFIPYTWENLIDNMKYHLESQSLKDYYDDDFSNKYLKY